MGKLWKDPPFLMGKLWKDPPFDSWVNQRFRLGHVLCRKLLAITGIYSGKKWQVITALIKLVIPWAKFAATEMSDDVGSYCKHIFPVNPVTGLVTANQFAKVLNLNL